MFLGHPSVGLMGGASSYVLSTQQVSITIATGATTNTATINAVSSNAFLIYQGMANTATNGTGDFPVTMTRAELTNSTTVTATRNSSSGSFTSTINAVVIDPATALVESVQAGTITITAGTSNTATITSVDLTRSAVFYLGHTQTGTTLQLPSVTLTNATTVTATSASSMTGTISYVVVQFKAAAIQSVQQFANAYTTANAADTQTITSVSTANSMIAYGGDIWSTVSYDFFYWLTLTNSTTVTATRNNTSTNSRTPYYTVIEFKPGVLKSIQRGSISISAATSNTATVTSVDTTKSAVTHLGLKTGNTVPNQVFSKITLTNATTLTASSGGGSTTEDVGYELIEFN